MTTKKFTQILDEVSASLSLLGSTGVLPMLRDLELRRQGAPGNWVVKAYVGGVNGFETAAEAVAAVKAYAAHGEREVIIRDAYPSIAQPSGMQVSLKTHIVLDGIPVEVCALLDGAEYAGVVAEAESAVTA